MDIVIYFSNLFGMYLIVVNFSRLLTLTRKYNLLTKITSTNTFRPVPNLVPKLLLQIFSGGLPLVVICHGNPYLM